MIKLIRVLLLTLILGVICSCHNFQKKNDTSSKENSKLVNTTVHKDSINQDSVVSSKLSSMSEQKKVPKFLNSKQKFHFNDFETTIYLGELVQPDFKNTPFGNDPEFIEFISKGCEKNGINFAGYFTAIRRGCGAECQHIFVVNRKTGQIYDEINLNEGNYGFAYKKNSTLLIANSNLFIDSSYTTYVNRIAWKPEYYNWENEKFVKKN